MLQDNNSIQLNAQDKHGTKELLLILKHQVLIFSTWFTLLC